MCSYKGALLAFLLLVLAVTSLLISTVLAKPVGPNPENPWPNNTMWGTKLRLENGIYIGEAWFGAKAGVTIKTSSPGGLMWPGFVENIHSYFMWVDNSLVYGTPPQSFSWYVKFNRSTSGEVPTAGVASIVPENADTSFVPQDFSVVLDNSAEGIFVNLKKENKLITGLPKYATLYVDNAVNIQSIDNLDPLIGKVGNNLRLRVTVKNTGRYTDNYAVSAGGSLDPTIPNLAPDNTDNVIVTTTYPSGIENIVITADGNYATDEDYITVTGISGPFLINGNDNFTLANGVSSGSGAENDPYIIENWDISAGYEFGIHIENTTAYFAIRNCYVHDAGEIVGENWVMTYSGIYLDNVVNGKIDNCKIDNSVFGILLHASFNISITNNRFDNNGSSIAFFDSSSNVLTNNTCSNDSVGFSLQHCDNNIINNNICENNRSGIGLSGSYNVLENNKCDNDSDFGISIGGSYNVLTNNTCTNNQWGINLYFSDNNSLTNNECDNNHYGIEFDFSDNNTMTNNTCENSWQSIILWGLYDNFIYHNNNNLIYHNNFINDTTQAYDDGSNYWDNGYPSGGNYWSDYTGADDFKGENQNISGGEGIGDTPYSISGGTNLDFYPLMYPWPCSIENYIIHLFAGWNLVGFVAENTPNNIFTGLTQPDNYLMYYWNAPGGPYGLHDSNTACRDNVGYWVFIHQNRWLGTRGTHPASRDIHFVAGWNLVSFPIVDNTTTPNNIFAPLVFNVNYIMYYWNAPSGPYGLVDSTKVLNDNTGYWVWINQDWTVTVP